GYIEDQTVLVDYRWAQDQTDRLPALAADLVRRRVAVIAASGGPAAESAAKATTSIPIVFTVAEDPVRMGLVASLARPGGNLTGVNFFLRNWPQNVSHSCLSWYPQPFVLPCCSIRPRSRLPQPTYATWKTAARAMALEIKVFNARTSGEIDATFAAIARERPDAIFISSGPLFTSRRVQLAHLATHHRIPAIHGSRFYPEVGGLISYGASVPDPHRQAGVYVGRILKGAKPADLPVVQMSKFELVINHQTARLLGLTAPPSLLSTADEVIE